LNNDYVAPVYHVDEHQGAPFFVMPLLQGETLADRLQREGALPPEEAVRIGRQIALGLAAAHAAGLIHRDIKPSNVWLEKLPGDAPRVKLLDFGLAGPVREEGLARSGLTDPGAVLGTPAYMAPEQVDGNPEPRSDLFSLGCVLYRATTGRHPFEAKGVLQT